MAHRCMLFCAEATDGIAPLTCKTAMQAQLAGTTATFRLFTITCIIAAIS